MGGVSQAVQAVIAYQLGYLLPRRFFWRQPGGMATIRILPIVRLLASIPTEIGCET